MTTTVAPVPPLLEIVWTLPSVPYGSTFFSILPLASPSIQSWVTRIFGFLIPELTDQAQDPGKSLFLRYLSITRSCDKKLFQLYECICVHFVRIKTQPCDLKIQDG